MAQGDAATAGAGGKITAIRRVATGSVQGGRLRKPYPCRREEDCPEEKAQTFQLEAKYRFLFQNFKGPRFHEFPTSDPA